MAELTNAQKGTIAYRILLSIMMGLATVIGSMVLNYAKSSDSKLSRIDNDVSQIKWELPVIKSTISNDRGAVEKQIAALTLRLDHFQAAGEGRSEKISKLQTELALLKQKLDLP